MGFFDWFSSKPKNSAPRCVGCDSTDIELLAPDAYRCVCGYEGGDGYAAYQLGLRREAYQSQDVDALRAKAMALVDEGRVRLSSVAGVPDLLDGTDFKLGSVKVRFGSDDPSSTDIEEAERRAIERDVAGTFVHQQVLEIAAITEVMISKGAPGLQHVAAVASRSTPQIQASGAALVEVGRLLEGKLPRV